MPGAPATARGRRWRLLPPAPPLLASALGVPPLWAQLLYNRGLRDPESAHRFLHPGPLTDPFRLAGMDRAVHRLLRAVLGGERVAIFGDFDTDGVTGTAVLCSALEGLGAQPLPYLPHRLREGHGLNPEAVRRLRAQGATLLVTVDCGVSSAEEVRLARDLGMEVVVTDHHSLAEGLPEAWALVSPRRPGVPPDLEPLTGAGIALKVAQGLFTALGRPLPEDLTALASLGTVADLAPLTGENRRLVALGLSALNRTQRPGLRALVEEAGLRPGTLDTERIAFALAPRLNSAGRLDHADPSLRLLLTRSEEEARDLARSLDRLNSQRQRLTQRALEEVWEEASAQAQEEALLMVGGEGVPPGVAGLVASKLVEAFHRPAVVVACEEGLARGSGRSIPEFNLVEALHACRDLFHRYGGHPGAGGFVTPAERLPDLRRRLQALARQALAGVDLTPTLEVEARVSLRDLVGETFAFLQRLAPFGVGNPRPRFLAQGVEVVSLRRVGEGGEHLLLCLRQDRAVWDAVAFGLANAWPEASRVDLVFTLGQDTYYGTPRLRLHVEDVRPSGGAQRVR